MRKTYKYRMHSTIQTIERANKWIELCRILYNAALEQRISVYKQSKKSLSYYGQSKELPSLKEAMPEFQDIDAQALRESLQRLDYAFKSFYRRIKSKKIPRFPRFKGRNRYDSFTLLQNSWRLESRYLHVSKIGKFKLNLSRPIQGTIKAITIKRTPTNKWYACFSCDNVPERKLLDSNEVIGLDVGIKSFCVDSEGNKIDNPLYLRQAEAILRRKQRKLSRRARGSNRRKKARLLVAKCHEKIKNQRNDFLHKLANRYVQNCGLICVEDLKVQNMTKNHHLAKSIGDSSWGKFFELLSYKAAEAGRRIIKVNPNGTSQICSQCGEKVEKTLAERTHHCPYCGLILDRDENAARNILQVGQTCQEPAYAVAHSVS